jgi:rRNA maturation endonuclease Nob1
MECENCGAEMQEVEDGLFCKICGNFIEIKIDRRKKEVSYIN